MKSLRQSIIKEIIEEEIIETQDDLTKSLSERGVKVTQATVSRDIKELMLIKIPSIDGKYRYALPVDKDILYSKQRLNSIFKDSVLNINYSENIVVIKTLPGSANAVASSLDCAKWSEIIGTVAGDDNILIVVKPISAVNDLMIKLQNLLR